MNFKLEINVIYYKIIVKFFDNGIEFKVKFFYSNFVIMCIDISVMLGSMILKKSMVIELDSFDFEFDFCYLLNIIWGILLNFFEFVFLFKSNNCYLKNYEIYEIDWICKILVWF